MSGDEVAALLDACAELLYNNTTVSLHASCLTWLLGETTLV